MKKNSFYSFFFFGMIVISFAFLSCNNDNNEPTTTETTSSGSDTSRVTHAIDSANRPLQNHAEAVLSSVYADTSVSGTVKFDADSAGRVTMNIELNIPAKAGKTVAVHIHEHGNCTDTAKAAHGHWNPTNANHGKWGSPDFHSGDIGNIKLDSKGKGVLSITTDLWRLGGTPDKNILGKSIIVHGGMDDYTTQPSGNSGSRIGCAVIR